MHRIPRFFPMHSPNNYSSCLRWQVVIATHTQHTMFSHINNSTISRILHYFEYSDVIYEIIVVCLSASMTLMWPFMAYTASDTSVLLCTCACAHGSALLY